MTSIGDYAFNYCRGLTSVTIGKSVTSIGIWAFVGCYDLASITFGDNLVSVSPDSFESTQWLNDQPNGVVYLGKTAYRYKGKMPPNTEIILKDGTVAISGGAFGGCSNLTSITIPNSVISIDNSAFSGCTGLTSVIIPNSVTNIGYEAFVGCTALTSVNIGNNVQAVGKEAFKGCTGMTSIVIPNSVDSISNNAFSDCTGLTSIKLSNSLRCIEENAFSGCTGLSSITIPNSVLTIGLSAFANCTELKSIDIFNSVVYIDEGAFDGTSWYDNQPDGLVYAGNVAYKYKGTMPSGSKLVIKEGTSGITRHAFYDCAGLTSIDIPNSVTKIGYEAFRYCTNLTEVYCRAEEVPNTHESVFWDTPWEHLYTTRLYVPENSIDLYKTAYPWEYFHEIIALTDDDPTSMVKQSLKSNDNTYPVEIYTLDGKRKSQPQRGLNIFRMSDGTTKKVFVK